MSGAGRGVTPGAEPEAGQGGSAASSGPGQDRPASADPTVDPSMDHDAETPGPGQADSGATAEASGRAEDGAEAPGAPPSGTSGQPGQSGKPGQPAARRRRKRSFWREFPVLVVVAL